MRMIWIAALAAILGGCASKDIRITGMVCPVGVSEAQMRADLNECRLYDYDAATRASQPKVVPSECVECLEQKGYRIIE